MTHTLTKTPTRTFTPTAVLGGFVVDNYRCYRARDGEAKPTPLPELSFADAFDGKDVKVTRPVMFCSPADVDSETAQNLGDYLVCYKTRDLPGQARFASRKVKMRNRFGDDVDIEMLAPGLLCLHSRRILPPATDTPAPPPPTATRTPSPP